MQGFVRYATYRTDHLPDRNLFTTACEVRAQV
jgi:hypothetical protein